MSLKQWADNGWLRVHRSSRQEVTDLLSIVDRDLEDARRTEISADWRFGIAYNATLKLCTILLHASGWRPERLLQHYRTIQALPLVLGASKRRDADYLEACRKKRNTVEYDIAGAATSADADELLAFARSLRDETLAWLRTARPELLPRADHEP